KPEVYKDAAVRFVFDYPRSQLNPRAQAILKAIKDFESGKLNYIAPPAPPAATTKSQPLTPPAPAAPAYVLNSAAPHYFVVAYPRGSSAFKNISKQYSDYNTRFNQTDNLTLSPYVLGDSVELMVVKGFPDSRRAQTYEVKQKAPQSPIGKIRGIDFTTFVISADNFPIFYKAANLEEYMAFYRKNDQK